MSHDIDRLDIHERQRLVDDTQPRGNVWTDIGEAQVTHTIFGKARAHPSQAGCCAPGRALDDPGYRGDRRRSLAGLDLLATTRDHSGHKSRAGGRAECPCTDDPAGTGARSGKTSDTGSRTANNTARRDRKVTHRAKAAGHPEVTDPKWRQHFSARCGQAVPDGCQQPGGRPCPA